MPLWKFIIIENMENNNSGIALIISHMYNIKKKKL